MELHDEKRISDYPALFPKAKLRLMVTMRGGPINTRRSKFLSYFITIFFIVFSFELSLSFSFHI